MSWDVWGTENGAVRQFEFGMEIEEWGFSADELANHKKG